MTTVSGIVILCKLPYRALIESGLRVRSQSVHGTVWQLTECDDTKYCSHTIFFLLKMSTSMLETCRGI